MNVRSKLFGAMAVLVILVTMAYFGTTQGYLESRFGDYTVNEMAALLQSYYDNHDHSWEGLEKSDLPEIVSQGRTQTGGLVLLSPNGELIWSQGRAEPQETRQHGYHKQIKVDGAIVGTVYTYRWESDESGKLKHFVLHSMAREGFLVAALTAAIALLLGLWLTWRLTLPLKKLIRPIGQIAEGELRIHIPVTSKDEFGKVAQALNSLAARLLRAEEVRKQQTADIAHELRTPLSIVHAQLDNIQSDARDVPPEMLLPIQDEVIRLSKLIDDLHQLTLAEAGVLPIHRVQIDIVSLVDRVIDKVGFEAQERHQTILRSYDMDTLNVCIDPNRMTQVFYNLLTNAMRYTPDGGTIEIRIAEQVEEGRRYTTVTMIDSGPGISPENLPYIFDRFYRVEESRSRHSGGMGLGLAIAKEYVEAHEGTLMVASAVGRGSSFTVKLPAGSRDHNC